MQSGVARDCVEASTGPVCQRTTRHCVPGVPPTLPEIQEVDNVRALTFWRRRVLDPRCGISEARPSARSYAGAESERPELRESGGRRRRHQLRIAGGSGRPRPG